MRNNEISRHNNHRNKLNDVLEKNNQLLRVKNYSPTKSVLSNGLVIERRNDVITLNRRILKSPYVTMFDLLYNIDSNIREKYYRQMKHDIAKKGGLGCQDKHGDKIRNNLNTGNPWNKDIQTGLSPWNKGLTKEDDDRLLKLSCDRMGEGNPSFGVIPTKEQRYKQSVSVKKLIMNGDFTPNIHNSHTHWQVYYNNKKYRSSWEAFFHHFNQDYEYETLRIPYNIEGKDKIYIVDFVNHNTKHIVELKPMCRVNGKVERTKEECLSEWCYLNGYTYDILTEEYITDNIHRLADGVFDEETTRKLNATRKKN